MCFIAWQKAFDDVNWTEIKQILKEAGIDWHERRLIGKSCMNQEYESTTGPERQEGVKIGKRS
jgi:hypothetical protein